MDRPSTLSHSPVRTRVHQLRRNTHAGFSLIEVLVAVAILGLGLTGWSLLIAVGISSHQEALTRTQATLLAYDLMDRIRANHIKPDGPEALLLTKPFTTAELSRCQLELAGADNERICWHTRVRERLPGSHASVDAASDQFAIELFWFDPRAGADPQLASQAQCEDPQGPARVWSANPSINWVPAGSAPRPASCLHVQRWHLPL